DTRHHQVHEHHVGSDALQQLDCFLAAACLADHLDVWFGGQQCLDTPADDGLIVGYDDADHGLARWHRIAHHGTSTITRVPAPGALSRQSAPPSCSARSRMPVNPRPPPGSAVRKPSPSSVISSRTRPSATSSTTVTRLAWACLRTLFSAS